MCRCSRRLSLRAPPHSRRHRARRGGLVAADVATYSSLSSFLIGRTDSSLEQAHVSAEQAIPHESRGDSRGGGPRGGNQFSIGADYVQVRLLSGKVIRSVAARPFPDAEASPSRGCRRRSTSPSRRTGTTACGTSPSRRSAGASATGCARQSRASASNYVLIVAAPLHDVDSTLHRLLWIELLVTGSCSPASPRSGCGSCA